VGTFRGVATKSVGPNLYGGPAEFTRARAFLLVGVVSVLGLIMTVTWTVVRNDPASSDSDPSQGAPLVAGTADDGLPPAGARSFSADHAALPTAAGTSGPAGGPIGPIALFAGFAEAPPATPSTVAPPTSAAAAPQPAPASVATPPTSPPASAAVETPAPPAATTPAVVSLASEPAGPTDEGRDKKSREDADAVKAAKAAEEQVKQAQKAAEEQVKQTQKAAEEQLKQTQEAAKELAKAGAKLDDAVKGKGGQG
jgi:hypothetical protein